MRVDKLKNLADLSSLEFKAFIESFDNVLCDCDGVLWLLNSKIEDANITVSKLNKLGKRVGAVTNNSTRRIEDLHMIFKERKFDIEIENIVYPTLAIVDYLTKINFEKEVFVLGCPAMKSEISKGGFKLAETGPTLIEESFEALGEILEDNTNVGAVVFDIDFNLSYAKIVRAAIYLQRPEVLYIAGSTDRTLPFGKPAAIIGIGDLQSCLKDFTGKSPICLGKPSDEFNKFVVKKFDIKEPSRTLFVGDSLSHDIYFANTHGYQSLFVLTGTSKLEDVETCSKDMVPHFYLNSFGDLHTLIKEKM